MILSRNIIWPQNIKKCDVLCQLLYITLKFLNKLSFAISKLLFCPKFLIIAHCCYVVQRNTVKEFQECSYNLTFLKRSIFFSWRRLSLAVIFKWENVILKIALAIRYWWYFAILTIFMFQPIIIDIGTTTPTTTWMIGNIFDSENNGEQADWPMKIESC